MTRYFYEFDQSANQWAVFDKFYPERQFLVVSEGDADDAVYLLNELYNRADK